MAGKVVVQGVAARAGMIAAGALLAWGLLFGAVAPGAARAGDLLEEISVEGEVGCTESSPCLKAVDGVTYVLAGAVLFPGEKAIVTGILGKDAKGHPKIDVLEYVILDDEPDDKGDGGGQDDKGLGDKASGENSGASVG
ncbi:MAG: hypothetical protein H0S85_09115 [Desulfovibrionaceae bacterium]|jgi:hypothetical protein|nr:hypothetical protein [Desulfovibrionaceae bacterium]